jgi:alanine-glyoxylate transaminase/serine-glyoxylate transaminase/serine-pyruvate transaminase
MQIPSAFIPPPRLSEFNIETGAGLGSLKGNIWRIGLMGESSRMEKVGAVLNALEEILKKWRAASKEEAPSTNIQAPEKLQAPSFKSRRA